MIPKRVTLENFLSFGTPKTEIAFADDEPLWVLGGANGVGKSAVFDAMTFALFGQHRGGAQNHDLLVRHGANGFSVTFEFEFNGIDYRITRNRMGSRSTASVERKSATTWERVPNVNSIADVRGWSERTLGLEFNAFSASVLLRQGKADEIITATGARRLEILKKIIGAERFESLSARVHAAAKVCKTKLDELVAQRDTCDRTGRGDVPDTDLQTAREAVGQADILRERARDAAMAAGQRVELAKQWAALEADRVRLEGQILAAKSRATDEDRIRSDKRRLDDLASAVPTLLKFVEVRDRIASAEEAREKELIAKQQLSERVLTLAEAVQRAREAASGHSDMAKRLADEARQFRQEAERDAKFIPVAEGIDGLRKELGQFEKDLDERLATACDRLSLAGACVTDHEKKKAEVTGLLKHAREQQQKFAVLGVGVPCSLCGQPVTENHAELERARLAAAVRELEHRERNAGEALDQAKCEKVTAEETHRHLDGQVRDRDAKAKQRADQEKTLSGVGVTADPAELRRQVDDKKARAERLDLEAATAAANHTNANREANQNEIERKAQADELTKLEGRLGDIERNLASDRGQRGPLLDRLSDDWQRQADTIAPDEVRSLDSERARLAASDVNELFRQLEQDATRCEEWTKQLVDVAQKIDAIPPEARVAAATAEVEQEAARKVASDADESWTRAHNAAVDLEQRAAEYRKLAGDITTADRRHNLHRKLDELLGKEGLQRELVRDAEREIVRLANDTVRNLSDGDLSVELDQAAESDDEAFTLRVRRADDPLPIGVDYLSGSQKFRVAVAVALAIGRFAAGQARQLECVIIDEGFGSLDRDGLRAARDELNRLRHFLRRIILVSHQEEFAKEFPVVIQLARGPGGTTATRFRHEDGVRV